MKASLTIFNLGAAVEWLKFIAEMTKALAWPLVILILAGMFRKSAGTLLEQLATLEFAGAKMSFEKQVKALRDEAVDEATASESGIGNQAHKEQDTTEHAREPAATAEKLRKKLNEFSLTVLEGSPIGIVLAAWAGLEHYLFEVWKRLNTGKREPPPQPGLDLINALAFAGTITADTATMLRRARYLRNKAAHGSSGMTTKAAASEYRDLIATLILRVEQEASR